MDKKHDEDALDFEAEDGECEEKEPLAAPKGDKEGLCYLGAVHAYFKNSKNLTGTYFVN